MTKKIALITGILGQDGYYLSKFLIKQGYYVIGITSHDNVINKILLTSVSFKKFFILI